MIKRYSIEGKKLCIVDEALGLDINERFDPKSIDHNEYFMPKREGQVQWIKKNSKGEPLMSACAFDQKFHGPLYHYFSNKKLASCTWFYHGLRVGSCEKYYPTGEPYSLAQFSLKSEKVSFTGWYESGSLRSEIAYKDGRVHGTIKLYWPGGLLKRECECALGQKEGRERIWDEKGVLKEDAVFQQGRQKHIHKSVLDGINA